MRALSSRLCRGKLTQPTRDFLSVSLTYIFIWDSAYETNLETLIILHKLFLRAILFQNKNKASKLLLQQLNLVPLKYIFVYTVLKLCYARSGDLTQLENAYRLRLIQRPKNTYFPKSVLFQLQRYLITVIMRLR